MSHEDCQGTDRRGFLQAGALATAAATMGPGTAATAQEPAAAEAILPKRKLGKTGVAITLLEMARGPCASAARWRG